MRGGQACAACKHQRRRCWPGCALARHFPAERAAEFRSVHRLFGVSNLMRIRGAAPPHLRDHAVRAMVFEAEARRRDPVHGCLGLVRSLSARINAVAREIAAVRRQIDRHRTRDAFATGFPEEIGCSGALMKSIVVGSSEAAEPSSSSSSSSSTNYSMTFKPHCTVEDGVET
uniref:LOB domain-containing protein n=1 Tax=Ananas comosus var. bracteatus TaxID=296719 RepID=A0A6V7QJZ8_ANACO|nr:unnamed protein product [Ananas comosus var. bracteatus]